MSPTYMPYVAIACMIVFFHAGTLAASIWLGVMSRKKRWPSAGALATPEHADPSPLAG